MSCIHTQVRANATRILSQQCSGWFVFATRMENVCTGMQHMHIWVVCTRVVIACVYKTWPAPCIRLAPLKFHSTNQDSACGKNFTVLTSMKVNRTKHWIKAIYLTGDWLKYSWKRDLQLPKPYQTVKREIYETLCVSTLAIWHQKWVTTFRHGS